MFCDIYLAKRFNSLPKCTIDNDPGNEEASSKLQANTSHLVYSLGYVQHEETETRMSYLRLGWLTTYWKNSSDGILALAAVSLSFFQTSIVTSLGNTQSSSLAISPPWAVQFLESNLLQAKQSSYWLESNSAFLPTFRVPPVPTGGPGKVGGEGGEDVEEGPG